MNTLQKRAVEEARNLTDRARSKIMPLAWEKNEAKRKKLVDEAYFDITQAQSWLIKVLESAD